MRAKYLVCRRTHHNEPRPGLKPGPLDTESSILTIILSFLRGSGGGGRGASTGLKYHMNTKPFFFLILTSTSLP